MEKKLECHCLTLQQVHLLNVISDFGNFISSAFFYFLHYMHSGGWGHSVGVHGVSLHGVGKDGVGVRSVDNWHAWRGRAQRGQGSMSCMAGPALGGITRRQREQHSQVYVLVRFVTEEFSKLFMVI
jgi:hypothetical protein